MRKISFLFCAVVFAWLLLAAEKETPPTAVPKVSPLVGTWEMVTPEMRALKFITPTHFIFIHTDPKTKEIANSMAGRYRHEGNTYTEILEFGTSAMKDFLGNEIKFNAKLEGDKWYHTGELPGGIKIDEVWTRVK